MYNMGKAWFILDTTSLEVFNLSYMVSYLRKLST